MSTFIPPAARGCVNAAITRRLLLGCILQRVSRLHVGTAGIRGVKTGNKRHDLLYVCFLRLLETGWSDPRIKRKFYRAWRNSRTARVRLSATARCKRLSARTLVASRSFQTIYNTFHTRTHGRCFRQLRKRRHVIVDDFSLLRICSCYRPDITERHCAIYRADSIALDRIIRGV